MTTRRTCCLLVPLALALACNEGEVGPSIGGMDGIAADSAVDGGGEGVPADPGEDPLPPPDGEDANPDLEPDVPGDEQTPDANPPDVVLPDVPDAEVTDLVVPDGCVAQCAGKQCGDDGCGGSCGACIQGSQCTGGVCKCVEGVQQWCCPDGKSLCWYDSCSNPGAKISDCPGGCVGNVCSGCIPSCAGKQCGDDGCGGSCGACTQGSQCTGGVCKCVPDAKQWCCLDWKGVCWFDSCSNQGAKIQDCPFGCSASQCLPCVPNCTGKQCGDNGCGGSCGTCPAGKNCKATTGQCIGCNPDCAGKSCGPNGCGGQCGTCPAGDDCVAGQCISTQPCTGLPQTWGPSGAIQTMSTPLVAATIASTCYDYTGDGKGDNGLSALAPFSSYFDINQAIQQAVDQGQLGMVFEFQGVTNFTDAPPFLLAGLRGQPSGGSTSYKLDPTAYDGHCNPLVAFEDAVIAAKALKAGPGYFIMILPLGGISMTLALEKARMGGSVTSGGAAGVAMTGGVIGGLLTQQALDDAMAGLDSQCSGPGAPSFCQYVSLLPMVLQMDTDTNGDGTLDAMSVCFQTTLKAVKVVGYL